MQRLTELYEARRYGGVMANPRLSAFASSPIPMLPKVAGRAAGASPVMRSWLVDDDRAFLNDSFCVKQIVVISE